jgi:thioredoxin 1
MQFHTKLSMLLALLLPMLALMGVAEEQRPAAIEQKVLPKLVDLGAKTCIPCKKMAPILEELKKEYAGIFEVEFIDVSDKANAESVTKYKIELIPTQVFLDAAGKELWRHQGFFSKEEILAKWKELKFDFMPAGQAATPVETKKD